MEVSVSLEAANRASAHARDHPSAVGQLLPRFDAMAGLQKTVNCVKVWKSKKKRVPRLGPCESSKAIVNGRRFRNCKRRLQDPPRSLPCA